MITKKLLIFIFIFSIFPDLVTAQILVADINQANEGSNPVSIRNNTEQLTFFANAEEGFALYVLEKESLIPELVHSLSKANLGTTLWASSLIDHHIYFVTNVKDTLYYQQSNILTKETKIFARLPMEGMGTGTIGYFTKLGTSIYFIHRAIQPTRFQLWKLDPETLTSEEIETFSINSFPRDLTVFNGAIYFTMGGGQEKGEVWKFDGTEASLLIDTDGINSADNYGTSELVPYKDHLFFIPYSPEFGYEIWRTDGTTEGTAIFKDFAKGNSSGSNNLTVINDLLYFTAKDSLAGFELHVSDGTIVGTDVYVDAEVGEENGGGFGYIAKNGIFYYSRFSDVGRELWRTDGTQKGTFILKDIYEGSRSGLEQYSQFIFLGDELIFTANDGITGLEFWRTDGTQEGTKRWLDLFTGPDESEIRGLQIFNNQLYFSAEDLQFGIELWKTDGTTSGTQLVADLNKRQSASSTPHRFNISNGKLYFTALTSATGFELFSTEGTSNTTKIVKDIHTGKESNFIDKITSLGGNIYFSAESHSEGNGLWRSDGTAEGTYMLKDNAGEIRFGGMGGTTRLKDFIITKGYIYGKGQSLVRSDGTSEGTEIIKILEPNRGVNGINNDFVNLGDTILLFSDGHPDFGPELWRTDGTPNGTYVLKNIRLLNDDRFHINRLNNFNGIAYFKADDGFSGEKVWRSDGTEQGTFALSNNIGSIRDIVYLNGEIFFTAYNSNARKYFLAKVSPDDKTTEIIYLFGLGRDFKYFQSLRVMNNQLFFVAYNDDSGQVLLRYDPSNYETEILKDNDAVFDETIRYLTVIDSVLVFSSNNEQSGSELWISDGTIAGTRMKSDINPGGASSNPSHFYPYEEFIYFSADAGNGIGTELYKFSPLDKDNDGYLPPEDLDDANPLVNIEGTSLKCDTLLSSMNDRWIFTGAYISDSSLSSNGKVDNSSIVVLGASKNVTLTEGFHAENGCNLTVKILSCNSESISSTFETTTIGVADLTTTKTPNFLVKVQPNPFNFNTSFIIELSNEKIVDLLIFDLNGRLVTQINRKKALSKGEHEFSIDTSKWQQGMYIAMIQIGAEIYTQKLILVR